MFQSLKHKLASIIIPWRSTSLLVQSKAKKISSKRNFSLKKYNQMPKQVSITPKKIAPIEKEDLLDQWETIGKGKSKTRNIYQNENKNEMKEQISKQISQKKLNVSQSLMSLSDCGTPQQTNKKSFELSFISQNEQQISQPIFSNLKEDSIINRCMSEKSFKQLLNTEDLDYLMIKIPKEKQSQKKQLNSEIKRKRVEEYQRNRAKFLRNKLRTQCIICEQKTDSRDSFQLTCSHKIHKICSDIIRWKPRMKCNKCERKSVKKIIFHLSQEKINKKFRLSLKKQKK